VNRPDAATDVASTPPPITRHGSGVGALFAGLLAVLLATGWTANHFAALIPAISDRQHLGVAALNVIFGVYALGLVPGLVIGGRLSDALGRQPVAWTGSVVGLAGTVAMLVSQHSVVLLIGRTIVGLGVGLAVSACTAWASDLRGPAGAAVAGAALTAGFAIGPFASGVISSMASAGIWESFGIAAILAAVSTVAAVVASRRVRLPAPTSSERSPQAALLGHGTARALSWALPLAPWVFSSNILAFVIIPPRVHHGAMAAPLAAGIAALISNGLSGIIQLVARSRGWGPQAGTVGALLAALGFGVTAAAPPTIPLDLGLVLLVVLGCASGLLLREGLIDLEAAAPQHVRGTLTGVFYAVAYIGFGLPLVFALVGTGVTAAILAVMAALAVATSVSRIVRLRRDSHRQS
jgi:MFS family permease